MLVKEIAMNVFGQPVAERRMSLGHWRYRLLHWCLDRESLMPCGMEALCALDGGALQQTLLAMAGYQRELDVMYGRGRLLTLVGGAKRGA